MRIVAIILIINLMVSLGFADTFGTDDNTVDMDFVTINNEFRIGMYEVSNAQWNVFKSELGLPITGSPDYAYDQSHPVTLDDRPAILVSWYEAAQFVNWLNTSTGHHPAYKFTGTQGQDDYSLALWSEDQLEEGNLYRHKDAFYYLPSSIEWRYAAYWNGSHFQAYSTPNNIAPIAGLDSNYGQIQLNPWNIYYGSEELNGTYNMMGNVLEWLEDSSDISNALSTRKISGSSYLSVLSQLTEESFGGSRAMWREELFVGLRVASDVPEPCSALLIVAGGFLVYSKSSKR